MQESSSGKLRRYWGLIAALLVVGGIIYCFSDIVTWLVLAWVLSLLGSPVMAALSRVKIGRFSLGPTLRAVIVLLLFYTVLGIFFYIFVPVIVQQGRNLTGVNYADIAKELEEPVAQIENWMIGHGLMEGELIDIAKLRDTTVNDSSAINLAIDSSSNDSTKLLPIGIDKGNQGNPLLSSTATIQIDSILMANGDTITKTNIGLDIRVAMDMPEARMEDMYHDTTAIVQPDDTPMEKFQKQFISFFDPSQIPRLFSTLVSWLGQILVLLTSVSFIAFFFLKDEDLFARSIKATVPNHLTDEVDTALAEIQKLLTRYFAGILLEMTLITIYMSVLLSIIGVPNAILIAFFAAVINVIPYIGPFIGACFGVLVAISSGIDPASTADFYVDTLPMIGKMLIAFVTMQILDGFVLQPYIFSNSVLAHPLEIFIVVIVGAKLIGITGMVIAIPIYTVVRVIASVFLDEFKIVQELTGSLGVQHINVEENDPNYQAAETSSGDLTEGDDADLEGGGTEVRKVDSESTKLKKNSSKDSADKKKDPPTKQ